jgi:hypothetical protein
MEFAGEKGGTGAVDRVAYADSGGGQTPFPSKARARGRGTTGTPEISCIDSVRATIRPLSYYAGTRASPPA